MTAGQRKAIKTNTNIDLITNDDIGDIIGFAETVLLLEKYNQITFTKDFDRDVELAELFRQSLQQYLREQIPYSYVEWLEDWLIYLEKKGDRQ